MKIMELVIFINVEKIMYIIHSYDKQQSVIFVFTVERL